MRRRRISLGALLLAIGLVAMVSPAAVAAPTPVAVMVPLSSSAAHSHGVAAALVGGDVSAAGVADFTFDSLHVDYVLTPGENGTGSLRVTETFVANFTNPDTHRGMRRILPTTYNGAPLHPTLVSITDGSGQARESESETDDGSYLMTSRSDEYVLGPQTYVFTYTLDNVMRNYASEDIDEFYWDVVGAEWSQPFNEVSMTLQIDPQLAEGLTGAAACYQGERDDTEPCALASSADGQTWELGDLALAPQQGITIAIGFEEGTITPFDGSYLSQPAAPWQLGIAGAGLAGFVGAIVVRRTALRDAPGRGIIVPQYEPPVGVDAMNAAALLHRPHGVTAEILEQAVRGSLRIRESGGKHTYVLELVDPSRGGDGNGMRTLSILFGDSLQPGTVVKGKASSSRAAKLQGLLAETKKRQLQAGLRRKPSSGYMVVFALFGAVVTAVAFVAAGVIFANTNNGLGFVVAIALSITSVIMVSLLGKRPYTAAGADVRDHLSGLKMFMNWAEADRIRMLQSPGGAERVQANPLEPATMLKLYEPLLPFAVVFGLEKTWTQTLQDYYDAGGSQPAWYAGHTAFTVSALNSVVQSFTPASSSSSSSGGSGGGGSVGGGGGGGGGGGV